MTDATGDREQHSHDDGDYCGICNSCEQPNWGAGTDEGAVEGDGSLPEFGTLECCALLVHFEDTSPRAPPAEFEQFLFGDEPDLSRERESVSDYWEEVSYGQLTLTSGPEGVGGWYEVPLTEAEYENADEPYDVLWTEAVKAAKQDGFDFGAYDDPFLLVYRAGGDTPAWGGPGGTFDGTEFEGSTLCWTQPTIGEMSISVSCHELGHAFGLPHAYNDGLGDLALMTFPGTGASPPSALCAHEKNNIGPDGWINWDGRSDWTGTTDVWLDAGETLGQPLVVPPAADVDENYRLWDGARDDGSRYTVEYRGGGGVDRNLDSTGLAVYYYPATSGFDYPLGGTTTTPDGSRFRTAQADIRHPDAEVEFELGTVETRYGCVLCNDPPDCSAPASSTRLHAIPIDLDDLPDGAAVNGDGDTRIDARAAWNDDSDDVWFELVAPDGSAHGQSTTKNGNFAIVRSERLGDSTAEGGWILRETVTGDGTVEYVRAINHPSYELATTTTVRDATVDGQRVTTTVELAFGDGSDYDPGGFGQPTADQFALEIAGGSVSPDAVTVTSEGSGTYTLTVEDVAASDGDELSATFTDEKAGATHTTTTGSTVIDAAAELGVSAPDVSLDRGGAVDLPVEVTAATELRVSDLWTDWAITDVTADGATFEDQVETAGTCTFGWDTTQSSATPAITVSLPDRYVGGQYLLTVTATGDGESVEVPVTVTVE